jgi:hypothetical protein
MPSKKAWRNFLRRNNLNGNRRIAKRNKVRSLAENKDALNAFFNGGTVTEDVDGTTVTRHVPGYLELLKRAWTTGSDGVSKTYEHHPERMGNFDESYLDGEATKRGVTARGQKFAACQGGGHVQPITFVGGVTFTGAPIVEAYITQGKETRQYLAHEADAQAIVAHRPDGYVMTAELMTDLLMEMARRIPGAPDAHPSEQRGRPRRSQPRHVTDLCNRRRREKQPLLAYFRRARVPCRPWRD